MKRIVLIVVGALVSIAMIPIIVLSINRITQEKVKEEVVTFEVLSETTVTSGTYNLINEYAVFIDVGVNYSATPKSIKINDTTNTTSVQIDDNGDNSFTIYGDGSGSYDFILNNDDTIISEGYTITVGDIWEITFEVTTPAQVTGVGAALLGLVPILFVLGTVFSLVIFTKEWN